MKLLLLLSLSALASAGNVRREFLASVGNLQPSAARFRLYTRNLAKISELNRNSGGKWRAGVTKFAVMTEAERLLHKGLNTTGRFDLHFSSPLSQSNAPTEVDWREAGYVTPPREQLGCGSCWIFAAVATIESRAAAAGSHPQHLSDQEIVDCGSPYRDACEGGDPLKALEYVFDRKALAREADYPYIGRSNYKCMRDGKENGLTGGVRQRYYDYRYGAEQMIAALAGGPIIVEFNAIEPFMFYKEGVFDYPKCGTQVDHAMAAVGYAPEYVILKNSWGTEWGLGGFAKVARGYNLCGMYKWGFHPNFLPATNAEQDQEK